MELKLPKHQSRVYVHIVTFSADGLVDFHAPVISYGSRADHARDFLFRILVQSSLLNTLNIIQSSMKLEEYR